MSSDFQKLTLTDNRYAAWYGPAWKQISRQFPRITQRGNAPRGGVLYVYQDAGLQHVDVGYRDLDGFRRP